MYGYNLDIIYFRLGLNRMEHIRSASTMWRATCSFPTYKSDIYRDYMRAKLSEIDILVFSGGGTCKTVDNINIRGHEGRKVTVPFYQEGAFPFHTDSTVTHCQFHVTEGSVGSEDNFGYYGSFNRAFRCTESDESTTQYWFGGNISHRNYV